LLSGIIQHTERMIHVIATITCTPGNRAAFLKEFHQVVPLVLQEDGCIAYGPTIDQSQALTINTPQRAEVVVVIEQWRDVPALQAHLVAEHMKAYRAKVTGFVDNIAVQVLEPA
jgi:quinol monooxygenase YgiN